MDERRNQSMRPDQAVNWDLLTFEADESGHEVRPDRDDDRIDHAARGADGPICV